MYTLLLVLMTLLAVLLIVIILLQAGKGGGLASTFGGASSSTDSFMGSRQTATLLTKLTWAGGGVFLFLGLVLSVLSAGQTGGSGESILRGQFGGPGAGQQGAPTSVLESERTGEGAAGSESGGILPRGSESQGDAGEPGTDAEGQGGSGG